MEQTRKQHLIKPHGGELIDIIVPPNRAKQLKRSSIKFTSIYLNRRQLCDLELLLNGGFSPLKTFMNQTDYESVCRDMRLANGLVWPMPITLDISEQFAKKIRIGESIALRDQEGVMLAVLTVGEIYKPDLMQEAQLVFGTTDDCHPGVAHLKTTAQPYCISGTLEGIQLPNHYDFIDMRHTPTQLRKIFSDNNWNNVVAFQTRNPMHRAHVELTVRAAKETNAKLLIQPVVGMTKPGDIDHFTRVRVYKALQNKFPESSTMISLLPLAMRMGGPREALWHAIIRKNYGANNFIVGRDHAGPGKDSNGKDFYDPYAAQELLQKYADEIGMNVVPFKMMVFVPSLNTYLPVDEVPEKEEYNSISGTELRQHLRDGKQLPEWFTYPEVAQELRKAHPPRAKQGFCVLFTGLSGAGKSTIANALAIKLQEIGTRTLTVLDGDIVRKNLSSELGFSHEHREINVRRIGYVASEIAKHRGVAICAPIAPYDSTRKEVRKLVNDAGGGFILVHVNTPIEICEQRDRKGLYAKARAGEVKEFTGISDPYEMPDDAEVTLDTLNFSPDELAQQVIDYLQDQGYFGQDTDASVSEDGANN